MFILRSMKWTPLKENLKSQSKRDEQKHGRILIKEEVINDFFLFVDLCLIMYIMSESLNFQG